MLAFDHDVALQVFLARDERTFSDFAVVRHQQHSPAGLAPRVQVLPVSHLVQASSFEDSDVPSCVGHVAPPADAPEPRGLGAGA
jgi:S-adenosylmethionine:diacylglycerol 3-amino-3-carboxypropyl transferase